MKRLILAGLGVLCLAAGLRFLTSIGDSDEVRLTGVVSANEALVASELSGRIRELRVDEGDWVRKGDVVAILETDELEADRQRQLALVEQLSAKLEQSHERVRLERDRVGRQIDRARANLQVAESQREAFRAELAQAKNDLARSVELRDQGLVPLQQVERQETTVEVIESRLQTAEDTVAAARAELELYEVAERQVRVMEQDAQQTEAQLAQSRAELEKITVRMGYTTLEAPLSGMVSVRVAREGEVVQAGAPVVSIVDLTDIWVRAEVEETLVGRVVVGQTLRVRLMSNEEMTGRVTFISPEAEFATQRDVDRVKRDIRTFAIKVAVPNPEGRLHAGMTAYVLLPTEANAPIAPALSPPEPGPLEKQTTRRRPEPNGWDDEAVETSSAGTGNDVESLDPHRWRLELIAMFDGKLSAVINGKRVFEGDTIEGALVVAIVDGLVRLEHEGRTFRLAL